MKLSLCADQLSLITLPTAQTSVFSRTHRRLCNHILEYCRFCLISTTKNEADMCWSLGLCIWTIIFKSRVASVAFPSNLFHSNYTLMLLPFDLWNVSIYDCIAQTSEKLKMPFELKRLYWLCFEKLSEVHCWKTVFNSDSYMSRECWTKTQYCQKAVEQ